ncbi:MAG: F0F1 ATP synthase subunit epsilon [Ignavibacteriaceae bacterium]
MKELNLDIVTPSKSVFKGEIKSITVPGTEGGFQVLKNHAPIVSTFDIGMIKVELLDSKVNYYSTAGGTIEVLDNEIVVLADSIELVSEIDVERAERAKKRAEERLAERASDINLTRARASLARAINRLNIYQKYSN